MKNKKTIFIIAAAIFLAAVLIYSLKSPPAASNGVSAGGVSVAGSSDNGESSGESDEIVRMLSMLSKVDLKTDFFEDSLFLSLEDLSVSPAEGEMGRSNPFSAY
ncbi:MAG: hypothetical protein UW04_C0050G0008 [Parcubacteria group bacterium GW2011_GWB1_43_8]|nr:MAG: hypothetical protein UW04_C0050G0008 [Parcubacteria group bacterium GW2011_GWB1_43_8]